MRLLAILACLLAPVGAFAADEAAHRPMTYALAVAAGFSPEEAKVIADACWSQDLNKITSASMNAPGEAVDYARWAEHVARNPDYAQKLLKDNNAADLVVFNPRGAMARVGPAAIIHSLMASLPARSGSPDQTRLDEAYRAYMRQEVARLKGSADPQTVKQVQLILVGQYLHEVVDTYVHPPNPIAGHATEGHTTDLVYLHQDQFVKAASRGLVTMKGLASEVPSDGRRQEALKLQTPEDLEKFSRGLVEKVSQGYDTDRPKSPNRWQMLKANPPSKKELTQISANAGEYVSRCFDRQGEKVFVKVPDFDQVRFTARDNQYKLEYKGKDVGNVDNVVTWVAGDQRFQDLKEPVRQALRTHVGVLRAVGEATRNEADADTRAGRKAVLEKVQVGGVNLEAAMDVLEMLDFPGIRSDDPISVIPRPTLVSLSKLLAKAPQKLPIGRVHGFVLGADDVYLIGTRTDEPIDLDCLVTAVSSVFKEGQTPAVSLDPKPDDVGGPQYSRVIGVPPRSQFARIMLDADYDMKKIMLGKLPVKVAAGKGYRSAWDLTVEQAKQQEGRTGHVRSRFWLYPVPLGIKDIRVSGDGTVFVFQTRVQVLTEQMSLVRDGLVGTGQEDPVHSEAAALFTARYEDIAEEHPSFRKLHALVDLVSVCSAWRRLGIRSEVLDRLAARSVADVDVPTSYPGASRQMQIGDGLLVVSGGAQVRTRMLQDSVDARDSAQMDRLRSAAASMKDVSVDLDRPLKTPLPPITRQGEFERLLGQGRAHLAARRPDQALRALEDATRAAPQYPDPDILRALALAMQGKGAQAVQAAGVAVSKDPTDPDLAGMARAIQARFGDISTASEYERRTASDSLTTAGYGLLNKGQTAQALENLESALKAWAQNPEALLGRGTARTVLGQNDAALKDLLQARKLFKREDNKNRLAVALAMSAAARLGVLDRDHASGELRLESAVRELDVVADEAAQAIDLDARLELGHYAHVQGRAFKAGLLQAAEQAVKWEGIQAAADDFIKKRPDSSMAYSARATVGFFRNEFKQAAEDLSKGIEINASCPTLYRQRAVAYHKAGDFGKAIADYNRSLQIAPADWGHAEATRQLLRLAQDKKQIP